MGAAALALVALTPACTAQPAPVVVSTATTVTPPPKATVTNSVVVAIDEVGPGFNPHQLADLSPVNNAVSGLVLPSVFLPEATGSGWTLDPSIAVSATPAATTKPTAPFQVTYVLRNEAQWSDGAPIAAEDFRYLWQQMISQPGVADAAGYDLITDVASSGGGKTVTVSFAADYPAWQQLFRSLLPAHLLKDLPGGFTAALDDGLPVSGSRFKVKSVDRDRGEVLLERNDRFWDTPTALDSILLRRDGTPNQLAESLRSKDAQMAQLHGSDATRTQLAAIPDVRTLTVAQPSTMRVAVDVGASGLSDVNVREGLLGLLDVDALSMIGAGRAVGQFRADAQVLAPSEPGYIATRPAGGTVTAAVEALGRAGYSLQAGRYLKNGTPLTVMVGAAKEDSAATSVAQAVADQLTSAGINAKASIVTSSELYGDRLGSGEIGMLVGRAPAGGDPATTLASTFGCTGSAGVAPAGAPTPTAAAGPTGTRSAPTTRLGNVSGVCDPSLQPQIDAALSGAVDVAATLAELEPRLWALHAVLPLYQDSTVLAVRKQVTGVDEPIGLRGGPFADAATWSRNDR
ncbi:ABC transporter family substrate-binding protein [Rhodococcus sp. X156]|uniref:ABC transporter family substrate-binding protein n=1 Tax=Rhodococcus sp. X156 TaxID=2499145 RepID=UPI000FDCBA33|nr:ABC transporter family substrate-binding protein [Rhodococcus sp. X156]